ncbi:hypothetical protein OUZ56_009682 [Daphnia magna]|uniref:Uncharacterized protein n=1 Tax=Daphnia magna TaxID=35525 RepID=A0ABR0AGN6_9CRUS|nr:hypothetical protein OUZ56_009682 [Daphnia magna]
MSRTSDGRNVLYGAPAQNPPVAPAKILLVAPAQTPKFVESNTGLLRPNRNLYTYTSGIWKSQNYFISMLAVSYQIESGLLDTFPSATREIRVLDLDERTVYKIIAFMKKVFVLNTINANKL